MSVLRFYAIFALSVAIVLAGIVALREADWFLRSLHRRRRELRRGGYLHARPGQTRKPW